MNTLTKLKMRFKKPKEVESLEIIADKCTGCGACVEMCVLNVFEMNHKNRVARVADIDSCVGCGKCVKKMCNFGAINLTLA